MPDFNYVGLNNDTGKQVKGTISADNEQEALDKIKAKGLTPMSVEEATAMTKSVSIGFGTAKPKPICRFSAVRWFRCYRPAFR